MNRMSVACSRGCDDDKLVKRFTRYFLVAATFLCLTACSTVTDLVTTHLPERHSGRASVLVDLREQEAYLFRGKYQTASSRISSGREGHRTPIGKFRVIRKDPEHRSSLYGDY